MKVGPWVPSFRNVACLCLNSAIIRTAVTCNLAWNICCLVALHVFVEWTLLSRSNKVGRKCPPTKHFFDFNEIWHVGRGRWVMYDGMQYDPIQGPGHKSFHFQKLSPLPFTMGAGNWPLILKLAKFRWAWFLIFVLVFVSRDLEVGRNVSCEESTVSPARG